MIAVMISLVKWSVWMLKRKHIAFSLAAFAVVLVVGAGVVWWVTRPIVTAVVTEVHLFPDGATKIVTEPVTPRRVWYLTRDALPDRAPVYTMLAPGDKEPGVIFYNATDHEVSSIEMPCPQRVVLNDDGSYSMIAPRIVLHVSDGTLSPGHANERVNTRFVPILYRPVNRAHSY